eukprot:CAMPEP_0118888190 /NCGR_PEP_ID=MMETSP1163-20130328/25567_1 /TAXON_ID=124430 /ORGANISM="Phaeomonas parva, Strain CCMP2877" /LENGTH=274 /DNA_ID=CAMNT_0006826753 /DNA_START=155 /DNA_END=979 /DNA_ORIENTATION=-
MGNFAGKEENYLADLDGDLDAQHMGAPMAPMPGGMMPPHGLGPHGSAPMMPPVPASAAGAAGDLGMGAGEGMDLEGKEDDGDTDTVPTVFRWEHGGRQVYITGTFNNWERQIPMHRSGNDFTYIHDLRRGKHAYKFVVDDEWRFAPDQPTVADIEGRINNFIDVHDFKSLEEQEEEEEEAAKSPDQNQEEEIYGQFVPDADDYAKEPPPLPPHLRHIILNKPSASADTLALPVPQHVALNHLYCTAIKDGMMVLGITQRYKQKHTTTVFYCPTT